MFKISATAPASLMLLGEHAVLHNYAALVCAVNRYLQVTLTPRFDKKIYISSAGLGELKTSLDEIGSDDRFKFIIAAIKTVKNELRTGFELDINANFSHQAGLGSSAAVTAATVTVFDRWLNPDKELIKKELFLKTRSIVRSVQGLGSGADVAASLYGGTLAYCLEPLVIKQLAHNPPITAIYSGSKKPTAEVVKWLEQQRLQQPETIRAIFNKIHLSCIKAQAYIEQADWPSLGKIFNENQTYMSELGLSNSTLDLLNHEIRTHPEIFGSKISGSGLGDCIVAIGELSSKQFPSNSSQQELGIQQFDLAITPEGVRYATE